MDLAKAIEFVNRQGNDVELARLKFILDGEYPSPTVLASLFAGQHSNGGWSPFWAPGYVSLDATCYRLAQAEQLGLTTSEIAIKQAVSFIVQRQKLDGSWEEDRQCANVAPPWVIPGSLAAKLYLTANCGLWLALFEGSHSGASKAAAYLQTHLSQDGHLPTFLHAHWLAGGLWLSLNWQEQASQVLDYLNHRLNDLAASNLAWLITTMCATKAQLGHSLVENAISLLEHRQENDGHWSSEDGPSQDVHTTLEAIRSLLLCGHIVKQSGAG